MDRVTWANDGQTTAAGSATTTRCERATRARGPLLKFLVRASSSSPVRLSRPARNVAEGADYQHAVKRGEAFNATVRLGRRGLVKRRRGHAALMGEQVHDIHQENRRDQHELAPPPPSPRSGLMGGILEWTGTLEAHLASVRTAALASKSARLRAASVFVPVRTAWSRQGFRLGGDARRHRQWGGRNRAVHRTVVLMNQPLLAEPTTWFMR